MPKLARLVVIAGLISLILPSALVTADVPPLNPCLYPSDHERFGITVGNDLARGWDVRPLSAGAYHNWWVNGAPSNLQGMRYYPVILVSEEGYQPDREQLRQLVSLHRGATWLVGNEVDTVWMGNARPETYVRYYHEIYHLIKSADPTAKVGFNGFATVSTLRLAWLDRAWATYRAFYGTDIPVDVWNIHTYVVNEMVHEWGPQIPPGIENAVGYTDGHWQPVAMPAASGGTVHASNTPGARAYFAVHGNSVTIYLRTGPDAGMVDIYVDNRALPPDPPKPVKPVERIDLYTPQPGVISRTYRDLPAGDPRLGNWHHVRVQVAWTRNPASSGTWVRVDAAEAASTASLPAGRLENDTPLRARIITSTDTYLDSGELLTQLRMFRRWMLEHGQRNKPLINSEFGVLLSEEQGGSYSQVSEFMLRSFDLFMKETVDAELGYPADGNRLLQEWFWFILAGDHFNGSRVHTGLFDTATRGILPLGVDFANYVQPLTQQYTDLLATYDQWTATWPLFADQPARFQMKAIVANRGQLAAGPFGISLTDGAAMIQEWAVATLAGREGAHTLTLDYAWESSAPGARTFVLTSDSTQQIDEPCEANNVLRYAVSGPAHTDLVVQDVKATVYRVSPWRRDRVPDVAVDVAVANLGSVGTESPTIAVTLWRAHADGSRQLLDRQQLSRASSAASSLRLWWQRADFGLHELVVEIEALPDEVDDANNRGVITVAVPSHVTYLPSTTRD